MGNYTIYQYLRKFLEHGSVTKRCLAPTCSFRYIPGTNQKLDYLPTRLPTGEERRKNPAFWHQRCRRNVGFQTMHMDANEFKTRRRHVVLVCITYSTVAHVRYSIYNMNADRCRRCHSRAWRPDPSKEVQSLLGAILPTLRTAAS